MASTALRKAWWVCRLFNGTLVDFRLYRIRWNEMFIYGKLQGTEMVLARIYIYRFDNELQKRWNSVKIVRITWC